MTSSALTELCTTSGTAAVLLAVAMFSCGQSAESATTLRAASSEELAVLTANYPLAYFARRIAGDRADIRFPGPEDEDPATWSPDRSALKQFQAADLVLLNGAGYSRWAEQLSLGLGRVIDTTADFGERWIEADGEATHSHGPAGADSHTHLAFTTWLDPTLAIEQCAAILRALARVDPLRAPIYRERFESLSAELSTLDQTLSEISALDPGRPLLASHPVYSYLARRLALNLQSVHWEPNRFPGAPDWRELERIRASHGASRMLWEGQPLPEIERELAKRGIECFVIDPCASTAGNSGLLNVLSENAQQLRLALSGPR